MPQRDGAPFAYSRDQLKNCWGLFSCPILLSLLLLGNSFQISHLYSTLASGSAFRAPKIGHAWNQGLCISRAHQAFLTQRSQEPCIKEQTVKNKEHFTKGSDWASFALVESELWQCEVEVEGSKRQEAGRPISRLLPVSQQGVTVRRQQSGSL